MRQHLPGLTRTQTLGECVMADSQPTQKAVETWKSVVGYEGFYEVSDHGRVRSLDRKLMSKAGYFRSYKGKLLSLNCQGKSPYPMVRLSSEGDSTLYAVHGLVMAAFIGPRPTGYHVDHIDNNPQNNNLSNLQYLTPLANIQRQKIFGTSISDRVASGEHNESAKTHCPRGHELISPNLVASDKKRGVRSCLACSRARTYIQYHKNLKPNLKEISDKYHEAIMKEGVN